MKRLLLLTAVSACAKSSQDPPPVDDLTTMTALKDEMCACTESTCADLVGTKLTAWSLARESKPASSDVDTMQKMSDLDEAYRRCLVRAANTHTRPPVVPATPPPPAEDLPAVPAGAITADRLWQAARTWARDRRRERVMSKATFEYVDASGALDPVDGKVIVVYGRVDESEAKRRIGAKVRPKQAFDDCFTLTNAGRWTETRSGCVETSSVNVRCSVEQIWKRAIAEHVPPDAVATLDVLIDASGAAWTFSIEDEPRNIHIRHTFADDCELAVEK